MISLREKDSNLHVCTRWCHEYKRKKSRKGKQRKTEMNQEDRKDIPQLAGGHHKGWVRKSHFEVTSESKRRAGKETDSKPRTLGILPRTRRWRRTMGHAKRWK